MSLTSHSKPRTPLILGVFLVLVGGAFLLGRRSVAPGPAQPLLTVASGKADAKEAGSHAEGGKGEGRSGVVKLDEEALRLANVRVDPIGYRSLQSRLPVTGEVEPNPSGVVKVTPRVAGKVTSLQANVGDSVRAGQPLAVLASTDLAAAQSAYRQASARVTVAWNALERQRKLARLGAFGRPRVEDARSQAAAAQGETGTTQGEVAASRNEVAEARSERAAAEAEVASAQEDVASAQGEVTEAEAQVKALQSAVAQTQTQVGVAKSRFDRAKLLLKEELMSRQEWEQAQADYQRAGADVDTARANLAQGQARVESTRARVKAADAKVRAARSKLEQADAKIQTAQARQGQSQAKLAAATRRGEIASQMLAREETVYQGGYLTSKEVVEAESAWRQAQLEQRAAADNIRLLGGTPGGGNTLTVAAPIGGRVTERLVTLGEMVTPEKAVFTIVNLSSVWVQLQVHQKDLPTVRVGQAVSVTSDTAPGRTFTGTISYIGDAVDESTRTVKVRAVFQNTGGTTGASDASPLKPQTFVEGAIASNTRAQSLAVPKDAVQTYEGKTVLFVQASRPGEFEAKPVQAGDPVEDWVPIHSGVTAGDRVVVQGAFVVKGQAMKSELGEKD